MSASESSIAPSIRVSGMQHAGHVERLLTAGIALHRAGRLDDARAVYLDALSVESGHVGVLVSLAVLEIQAGKPRRALQIAMAAIAVEPARADAWPPLAEAARLLGSFREAIAGGRRALLLGGRQVSILLSLGYSLVALGRFDEAQRMLDEAVLRRREPHATRPPQATEDCYFSRHAKLRHDIDQFMYLRSLGLLAEAFEPTIDAYSRVLEDRLRSDRIGPMFRLTDGERRLLGATYNRLVYRHPGGARRPRAISPSISGASVESDYEKRRPGIALFDGFLLPETLDELRRYCLRSTVWFDYRHAGGYLGAYMNDGFACPLLFQIAEELSALLPGVFRDAPLTEMWAYKYDSSGSGIALHADAAAINVNFWLTPDAANRMPGRGGLEVWDQEAPSEWDFERYNNDQKAIRRYLEAKSAKSYLIPYRCNRAVVFNSNLFHRTDDYRFADRYDDRRLNITMLFGRRRPG
jgi:tetratricopeptide (TPR) repeat protein